MKQCLLYLGVRKLSNEGYQALLAAEELGYDVILVGKKIPEYAKQFAKSVIEIDPTDVKLLYPIIKNIPIVGIPNWNENCVLSVSELCEKLHLPGTSLESAKITRNKYKMRENLIQYSEYLPKFFLVKSLFDLEKAMDNIGFPAILKPTNGAGSKGIFTIRNKQEGEVYFSYLKSIANIEKSDLFIEEEAGFIYEEFIKGKEFSVEGIVYLNHIHYAGITDKWTTDPYYIEYQHVFPGDSNDFLSKKIFEFSEKIVKKIGINNTAFHLEAKITDSGLKLIEIACRPAGDYIASHLISESTGIEFYKEVIRVAVGQRPKMQRERNLYTGVRFLIAKEEGYLNGINNLNYILSNPEIKYIFLHSDFKKHIDIPPKEFGSSRVGAFIAKHLTYDSCCKVMDEYSNECEVIINNIN